MTETLPTPQDVEEILKRGPFNRWLGLRVMKVSLDSIEVVATWREEWIVNPQHRYTHGGILAAVVDVAADWAMVARFGRGVPTIDLRVDYHRPALPGDLTATGRVVKGGKTFSVAEALVFDTDKKLVASGRGAYLSAVP